MNHDRVKIATAFNLHHHGLIKTKKDALRLLEEVCLAAFRQQATLDMFRDAIADVIDLDSYQRRD